MKPFLITRTLQVPEDGPDYDLGCLTAAETLVLWRYRQRATNGRLLGRSGTAMSQNEAATHLGVSPGTYARLEQGLSTSMSAEESRGLLTALGPLRPTLAELCFIARRRSGHNLNVMVERLETSRPTFLAMERASDPRVIASWEAAGYKFPTSAK